MFATVWAYKTDVKNKEDFIAAYGSEGRWANLFREHPGYVKTVLYEDIARPLFFMSVDLWNSRQDFEAFQKSHGHVYAALDREFSGLSEQSHYGFFDDVKDYAPLVFKT